jgi:Rad3-related DNA helicase
MLQGPPGTGKTSTLLGVLSGQYHYIRSRSLLGIKKILVCTPSNTAIDHIIKRIVL